MATATTGATFQINNASLYVPVVTFFDQLIKNQQEVYEKLAKMSRNNDYTTGHLLDFSYHQNYHILILQQINFTRKLEEDNGTTMFFITEKHQKTIINVS